MQLHCTCSVFFVEPEAAVLSFHSSLLLLIRMIQAKPPLSSNRSDIKSQGTSGPCVIKYPDSH